MIIVTFTGGRFDWLPISRLRDNPPRLFWGWWAFGLDDKSLAKWRAKRSRGRWVWKYNPTFWTRYVLPKDIGFDRGVEFAWLWWVIVWTGPTPKVGRP